MSASKNGSLMRTAATIDNEGVAEFRAAELVVALIFADKSSAADATIHNHGATSHQMEAAARRTFSTARPPGRRTSPTTPTERSCTVATRIPSSSIRRTPAPRRSKTRGAPSQSKMPGRTEFRNNSSAANATINNRGHITVGDLAGRTLFYDSGHGRQCHHPHL